jgi:DNA-binding CsgD family transcriptional regulator
MVAALASGGIRELFESLVPAEVIDAYDRLFTTGGCAKADAGTVAGSPAVVEALTSSGMAHILPHNPTRPAWLQPAPPDLALQGVLAAHQTRLARDTQLALDGQRRLAGAQARYSTPMTGDFPDHLVAALSDRAQISELSASLASTARKDWMTLENLATEMPLTPDFAAPPPPAAAGRVRCRSIYAAAMMDNPVARQIVTDSVTAGEEARLLPQVPMKMKLADTTTALLPLTPPGTAGALLVRAPVILTALRDYFDLLWEQAIPVTTPRQQAAAASEGLTQTEQRILELMAEGLQDAAIARRTGVSVVSVRRHITAILTKLSATSRFAAGAAAHRRGWIG